jgi:23S rRNA (cytidine1920-2'-O)/16S rRNA (cytidine1409-2'-O)-methyltransferase
VNARRLDEELVLRGLVASRSRARDLTLRGLVLVDGMTARKPSQPVRAHMVLTLADDADRYVSRAALKLVHGLDHFKIEVAGRTCLDLGASTGGFSQVLLERGATHVTAIEVGHGQMATALAADPRVTLLEGVNARALTRAQVPDGISLVVCDVSFISLKLALPPALALVAPGAEVLALIKPQFEVGRDNLGKGGIVRDAALLQQVCSDIAQWMTDAGLAVRGTVPSPVPGSDGNVEFLLSATTAGATPAA